jgi:hypothetical protein
MDRQEGYSEPKKARGAKGKQKEQEPTPVGIKLPQVLRIEEGNIAIFEEDDFNTVGDIDYSFAKEDHNFDVAHPVIEDFLKRVRLDELKVLPAGGKKIVQQKFHLLPSGTSLPSLT